MSMLFGLALLLAATDKIPESQLVTRVDDKEVFPPAFRGAWSKSAAHCRDENSLETFVVSETRLEGYEWDAVLLKTTPIFEQSGPKQGEWAHTVVVLTADRAETDVSFGQRRLSLSGDKLYMSNTEAVAEDEQFGADYANVRCP